MYVEGKVGGTHMKAEAVTADGNILSSERLLFREA
jgi:hypothetical protein